MPLHPNSIPADRYIVRLDGKKNAGWQLRIPPRHPQGPLTHYFPDSAYGGSDQAKEAARAMRDRMMARAGLDLLPKGHAVPKSGRPVDGLPAGITLGIYKPSVTRVLRITWVAYWSENTIQRKKTFSVFKYGFDEALLLALKYRAEKTGLQAKPSEIAAAMKLRGLANEALAEQPAPGLPKSL